MAEAEIKTITDAAHIESARMLTACEGRPDEAEVRMTVGHFRTLARLLAQSAEAAAHRPPAATPRGDFRFYVPMPQVEAERAELATLRETNARLKAEQDLQRLMV